MAEGWRPVTIFERDRAVARLMTRAELRSRSVFGKMFDEVSGLFRPQL